MRFRSMMIAAAIAGCGVLISNAASARSPYDGPWTVTMRTMRGDCSASFFFGVNIWNGHINASGGGFRLTGHVNSKGGVSATIGGGDRATGRLRRATGYGSWVSPARGCTGNWSAVRR
jgi:hypothetical protein